MVHQGHLHNLLADLQTCRSADLRNGTGPGEIQNRPTAYSLWALGTALEHCSVEVLLSAATALLLERLVRIAVLVPVSASGSFVRLIPPSPPPPLQASDRPAPKQVCTIGCCLCSAGTARAVAIPAYLLTVGTTHDVRACNSTSEYCLSTRYIDFMSHFSQGH